MNVVKESSDGGFCQATFFFRPSCIRAAMRQVKTQSVDLVLPLLAFTTFCIRKDSLLSAVCLFIGESGKFESKLLRTPVRRTSDLRIMRAQQEFVVLRKFSTQFDCSRSYNLRGFVHGVLDLTRSDPCIITISFQC